MSIPQIKTDNIKGNAELKNVMIAEKKLVDKLNAFYKEYNDYLRCVSCNLNGGVKCDRTQCNANKYTDAYNDVTAFVKEDGVYSQQLKELAAKSSHLDTANYENRHKEIKEMHKHIMKTRGQMDSDINFINNSQNSYRRIYENNYENSVYMGMVFTVLASSLIYYSFTKL